ncbi:MAG TPA: hypothetical protein VII95_13135 [Terriglobales bacterium]
MGETESGFLDYCRRLWREHLRHAAPWAPDNLIFGGVMLISPLIAVFLFYGKNAISNIDWRLVKTTGWLYLAALLIYAGFHFFKAAWKSDVHRQQEIAEARAAFVRKVAEKDADFAAMVRMKDGEFAARMREKECEIAAKNAEIERLTQPDVALVWDLTKDATKVKSWFGKSIIVHNRGDQYVYNVRIDPIPLRNPLTFDVINEIAPKSEEPAVGRWNAGSETRSTATDGYNQYIMANSEGLDEKGWTKKKSHNRGISPTFMEIPMAANFESQNTTWKIEFDWHYDPPDDDSYFSRKGGYKV